MVRVGKSLADTFFGSQGPVAADKRGEEAMLPAEQNALAERPYLYTEPDSRFQIDEVIHTETPQPPTTPPPTPTPTPVPTPSPQPGTGGQL